MPMFLKFIISLLNALMRSVIQACLGNIGHPAGHEIYSANGFTYRGLWKLFKKGVEPHVLFFSPNDEINLKVVNRGLVC